MDGVYSMPRQARVKGQFSIYHIILRGNEGKDIFFSNADRERFIHTLQKLKEKYGFEVYAYCLMSNHVHLLIYDNGNDISEIMKSLNTSFVMYMNKKYKRQGHFLQDRFRSEIIDTDLYLITASKYIHNNPVKAQLCKAPDEFFWSSFNCYMGKADTPHQLVDTTRILSWISHNEVKAQQEYLRFVMDQVFLSAQDDDIYYNDADFLANQQRFDNFESESHINTVAEAAEWLKNYMEKRNLTGEDVHNKNIRNEIIQTLREQSALTLKEIGQLFGLGITAVSKITHKAKSEIKNRP